MIDYINHIHSTS